MSDFLDIKPLTKNFSHSYQHTTVNYHICCVEGRTEFEEKRKISMLKIQQLRGDLVNQLVQRLNVTDAPHFYNLASLEGTLQCLMHITAR
ncbi:hypothetical protein AM593_01647, partial [Mytilus galloprovincialis]